MVAYPDGNVDAVVLLLALILLIRLANPPRPALRYRRVFIDIRCCVL